MPDTKPASVLFVCTGNSCRSQMAEGWTRHLHAGRLEAFSAGTAPAGLNPLAVRVMAEAGVDISGQTSKHLRDVPAAAIDHVITVCDAAREKCPALPGRRSAGHVSFDDPPYLARDARDEEAALPHYRRVRDAIRAFVEQLPTWLEQPDAT